MRFTCVERIADSFAPGSVLRVGAVAAMMFGASFQASGDPTLMPGATSAPRSYALLVGCTDYPYLDKGLWLNGPANDVLLWEAILSNDTFRIDRANIFKLAGWPANESERPTRANIELAFKRLATIARDGDQVAIILGGHGSQQPTNGDSAKEEPDGLDEIFLPADVKGWNGEKGVVENAITDNEIRTWLNAIRKKGAFVWFVADSCHSGTLTRGVPRDLERERRIRPDQLIPEEPLTAARKRASSRGAASPPIRESTVLKLDDDSAGLVAFYAVPPDETTPERPLPRNDDEYHGLFSYVIAKVLSDSSSPLTYRELADRVGSQYRAMGRYHPTPVIEGKDIDREILGVRVWPERPTLILGERDQKSGAYRLDAGDLQGLRQGSVLTAYPLAGSDNAEELIGHLRIVRTTPFDSLVHPIAYAGKPRPKPSRLVPGSRCSVVYVDYGELKIRIALQTQPQNSEVATTHDPGNGPEALERALSQLVKKHKGIATRVADPSQTDWFVRKTGDEVLLVPASGWSRSSSGQSVDLAPFTLGNLDAAGFADELRDVLRRIARARHLLMLADEGSPLREGGPDTNLELQMYRIEDGKEVLLEYQNGRLTRDGDEVFFRFTNTGRFPLDVTLLFVNSGHGIEGVWPCWAGEYNRLKSGETKDTTRWEVTAGDTFGPEQLIAIGIRSLGGPTTSLCRLQQATIVRQRDGGARTPLEQLLDSKLYGEGDVRGLRAAAMDEYIVKLLSWTVLPKSGN